MQLTDTSSYNTICDAIYANKDQSFCAEVRLSD